MTRPLKVGWCGPLERADRATALGFDFLEAHLAPLRLEDDVAFAAAKKAIAAALLPTPVFNQLMPRGLMVVGPAVDERRIRNYLPRVAEVTAAAGAELIVFGAGWARTVPLGWGRDRAMNQFLEMVSWCTDALQGTGVILAIEALNHGETNLLNTIAETVELVAQVNHPQVRTIADSHHLYAEPEPFDVITTAAPWITHVHLSDSGRLPPGDGTYDFQPLLNRLAASGYRGRLSIECMVEVGEPAMSRSLELVRRLWAATPGSGRE